MIEVLFPSLRREQFIADYWLTGTWSIEANSLILEKLAQAVSLLTDVTGILAKTDVDVQAWSPQGSHVCPALIARKLHDQGTALYLSHIDRHFSFLDPLLRKLEDELCVPRRSAHCSLFVSPVGAVIPQHFDHDFGFNVLLTGSKRWRLGSNNWVKWPVVGYQWGRTVPPDLLSFGLPPPSDNLCNVQERPVSKGSCVFVPRGAWHSTVADEYSVSLDFAVDPPNRVDHVLGCVRHLLLGNSDFRRSVDSSWMEWAASECDAFPSALREAGKNVLASGVECRSLTPLKGSDTVEITEGIAGGPYPITIHFRSQEQSIRRLSVTRNIGLRVCRWLKEAEVCNASANDVFDRLVNNTRILSGAEST